MRVLYLSSWPIGPRGEGPVSFVYEQIDALAAEVAAVYADLRFCSVWRWPARRLTGGTIRPIRSLWPAGVDAFEVWVPRWPTRVTRRTLLTDVRGAGRAVAGRVVRRVGPIDLVHAHVVLPAGLLGAAVAAALGVPLVLQEHSGPFEMHLDTPEKKMAVERVLEAAGVVIAVSDALRARMAPLCRVPEKMRVVANLVRTDLFRAAPLPAERDVMRVASVGSLIPGKGIEDLLAATALLNRMGQAIELRIIGDGPLRRALVERAAELGIAREVSFLGALTRREVAQALARAHVYVCASHHETFGLASAEALATGRPVVTTRCGGPEAFVDESCGALVPVQDPPALASALLETWQRITEFDPSRLHERIEQRFGPAIFRDRMLGLYREVVPPAGHA